MLISHLNPNSKLLAIASVFIFIFILYSNKKTNTVHFITTVYGAEKKKKKKNNANQIIELAKSKQ